LARGNITPKHQEDDTFCRLLDGISAISVNGSIMHNDPRGISRGQSDDLIIE